MSTLTTVLKGTTTFKHYDKPRYSKAKLYKNSNYPENHKEICCNCHKSYGEHYKIADIIKCPEYQILNK